MSRSRTRGRRLISAVAASALLGILASSPVAAAAPANDDIGSASVAGAIPYADGPYDTTEATTAATDPAFCFDPASGADRATVWYAFTPGAAGRYLADTFTSDYDTTLYVGTSNGAGGIDVIDCNDDANGLQSAVAWEATAGTTYLIMVGTCCGGGDAPGGGGSLVFHVSVAPPAPTIDVSLSRTGSFTPYGTATISGTATCTNTNGSVEVDVLLSQTVGRFVIRGEAFAFVECSDSPTPWSIDVTSPDGKFLGGHAVVDAFSVGCGVVECADDFDRVSLKLRR
jgi:hypothetical protein